MFVFNDETKAFIELVRSHFFQILKTETDLSLKGKKIYYKGYLYPINFVVFEDPKVLGYYNQHLFQIAINKEVIKINSQETLKNIIRHEMAHLYLHLTKEDSYKAHGKEFKEVFERFKWNKEFSKAQIKIDHSLQKKDKVSEKVKKLLDLSHSSNENEAQIAAKKAKDLIEKYNLTRNLSSSEDDTYASQVLSFKRKNSLTDGIYQVLSNYHVYPVYNQGRSKSYLEVIGEKVNVEIADYICAYLDFHVPRIWEKVKSENNLKGITAKNSFYRSFFKELDKKLKKERQGLKEIKLKGTELQNTSKDLELNLHQHVKRVYPRLSRVSSKSKKNCSHASELGKKNARDFSIKGALSKKGKSIKGILSWQR